jgi:hypothetical protein
MESLENEVCEEVLKGSVPLVFQGQPVKEGMALYLDPQPPLPMGDPFRGRQMPEIIPVGIPVFGDEIIGPGKEGLNPGGRLLNFGKDLLHFWRSFGNFHL